MCIVAFPFLARTDATGEEGGVHEVASRPVLPTAGKPRTMSLHEAIAYARLHHPSLQSALARVRVAEADLRVPRAQWLPNIGGVVETFEGTANNSTASYLSTSEVALPRIGATSVNTSAWSPSPSSLAAVGASQEIFDFGRIGAQVGVADAAITVERLTAFSERLRIDLLVKDACFAVLGARAILRASEDAFNRSKIHRDMAQAGVQSGLRAPIELTRAEADLTRFDVARVRAAGSLEEAQVVFAAAVGVPDPVLDAEEGSPQSEPLPLPEVMRDVLRRDPAIRVAQAGVDLQAATTQAIGALTRPELLLIGTFSGRAGGAHGTNGQSLTLDGWLPQIPNWDIGLILRWPLYDPVLAAQRDASATREGVARADLAVTVQAEVAAIRNAYVSLDVARAALVSLNKAAEAARANYAQAEARFRAGLGTSVELADGEALRTDAEIQVAVGEFQAARARAIVARLIAEER
ncbi:MAG: TolC family protein [Polyangia bacterium]